jgi:2-methylcitrate dehydratase PrpD
MIAEKLGQYLAECTFSDLPKRIVELAKMRVLDVLGAGMAGYRIGLYRPLLESLDLEGTCSSVVWGDGRLVSTRDAALINSFMAHSSYTEDGSRSTGGHPSSTVTPAILSLGEKIQISGEQLIVALVMGYEIFMRIGKAIYPSAVKIGFQPTAILGSIGSAAGCAKVLGLEGEASAHALAIGANLGSGLKAALKETSSQPLQVARSCEGGLIAALLAQSSVKGYEMILESYLEAFSGSSDESRVLENLGKGYEIEETYIKIHGGCRGNHAPLDVILKLVEKNNIDKENIQKIEIEIDSVTAGNEIHWPKNGKEAQFSIPFSVAAALVYGDASLFQFTDEKVEDAAIREIMEYVQVSVDPGLDQFLPSKRKSNGKIVMKNGRSYSDSIDFCRGEPEMPLDQKEVEKKFSFLAGGILGDKLPKVFDVISNLEKVQTIKTLTDLLKSNSSDG